VSGTITVLPLSKRDRQLGLAPETDLPLEALPFPAAVLDGSGVIVAVNSEWLSAHPAAAAGESCLRWCDEIHGLAGDLRTEFLAGIDNVLARRQERFSQDYGAAGNGRRRLILSSCPAGALALEQHLDAGIQSACEQPDWQSRKMETVGRLVGGVAHDFANILTLIAGYSDILWNRVGEGHPVRPELDEIRKAANRGARLTGQLLGFTRGQTVQPRIFDLNALIADMQRMLRPIIGEHVELQTSLRPNLGKVVADPGQMEQVIMNLILNARDAMPHGGRIRIETSDVELEPRRAGARGLQPGPHVILSISDSGHGISREAMDHMFEPFFTTKDKGKGTGLGLATVHSIVKQSGGAVWARGAPGEGATFTIALPRAVGTSERPETAAVASPAAAGTETVLLVEDDDNVRRLLTHVLQKRGYKVLDASSGEEALRIFEMRKAEIHLVLTDMVMPRMSGRELAERLRQARPEVKVIFMSGYTDDVLVRTGALSPGMSFLQKPLRPDALAAKVREALDAPTRPFNPR
jgi:two-component system, cell cycle sensor histidine kinase and response regulator CckA